MKRVLNLTLLLTIIVAAFLLGVVCKEQFARASEPSRKILHYVDPMHPAYVSDKPGIAPDCGMDLVPVYADEAIAGLAHERIAHSSDAIRISSEQQQLVGIKVAPAVPASGHSTLRLLGRVTADEARLYRVNAGIDGSIRDVASPTTGTQVRKGQLLATYIAPEFVSAAQAYIFALNATDRLKKNKTEFASQIDSATGDPINTNYQQRLERLENMGMSSAQIEEMARTREVPRNIRLVAPGGGFVLARSVSPGQKFDRGAELYRIADLSRVSVLADVFGRDAQNIKPGSVARITLPDQGLAFDAKVGAILPEVDPSTRTLRVRFEVENRGFALRPEMFVNIDVPVNAPAGVTLPQDAILDSGLRKTVFVEKEHGVFEPREVKTGRRFEDQVEITAGIIPGERVVLSGTFLVSSEAQLKGVDASPLASADVARNSSTDPTCGMHLDGRAIAAGHASRYRNTTYHFCSEACRRKFEAEPGRYLGEHARSEQARLGGVIQAGVAN